LSTALRQDLALLWMSTLLVLGRGYFFCLIHIPNIGSIVAADLSPVLLRLYQFGGRLSLLVAGD
jgi:hypothetical protein